MNRKGKLILTLLAFGVFLFCAVQFVVLPQREWKERQYAIAQDDALTHDIERVQDYKSAYMGDASNTANLFYHLPQNSDGMDFELDSAHCGLTVHYLTPLFDTGEEKVHRNLIYNTVAAMSLIDNLETITYDFSGASFTFTRAQIENAFQKNLSSLIEREIWTEQVQKKLNDKAFVAGFFNP